MRDSQDMRRMNNGQQQDGRGRGRGGARGRGGRPRQQCRDYNERGYCMRGDSCPYDHGTDRIILDDRALKGQFGGHASPGGMPPSIGQPPFYGTPNAFDSNHMVFYFLSAGMPPGNEGFAAENAGFSGGRPEPNVPGIEGGAPFISQRGARGGRGGPRGRGRGGFQASGGRSHHNRHNSTIIVENIPPEHCVIDKVNEYFKQFGTITNISLQPETSKAVIQYSNHAEADAAYSSPEVIFNNRFVKVYWQKTENKDQEGAAVTTPPKPAQPKTFEPSPEVVAAKAAEFAKLKEAKAKQQQARMQTMLELQKSKEQLIQKQIEEQKMLMEKLANAKTPEERSAIKQALNDIVNGASSPAPTPTFAPTAEAPDTSSEAAQTEEGKKEETAEELKAKLARLEAEAAALGLHGASPRGRGRGRGGYYATRGRGSWPRGGAVQKSYRLDNRTTKLMVKNLPQEEKDKLRQHFEQFGQLESVSYKDDIGSLVVQFKNRREAEVALARGANTLQGNALEMAWYNEPASESSNRESSAPSEGGSQNASPAAEVVSTEPVAQQ
ncbi:hypothetical protein INT43_005919 [Umbelopsis isabellina]|uniref:Uncharacterized protein n=1 Tax=Mortierella isabellina TaxID=91625 RepID=A0A8H7PIZ4_MORIS|nr:hypothetical protein INT43_005919 [Umbelopsis isabellina]